jgi:predicted transposase/invertase (TIGR01784 family)
MQFLSPTTDVAMKEADNFEVVPQKLQKSSEMVEAFHVLEKAQWTTSELERYITERDEQGRESRILQGALEQGHEEGLAKGLEQGEQKKSEEVAVNLLQEGMTTDFIVKVTKLTVEQVETLRKTLLKN